MQVHIDQQKQSIVDAAIAAGKARDADDFVAQLIHGYSTAAQKQAEIESVLLSALDSGIEEFDSAEAHRASMLNGFDDRLKRKTA